MAKYRCKVCGWIFDEEKEGITFDELTECYLCSAPKSEFEKVEDDGADAGAGTAGAAGIPASGGNELAVDPNLVRKDPDMRYMAEIHQMSETGHSIDAAMATMMPMPGWDDVLLMGAQLDPMPLDDDAQVSLKTVIGKKAAKPMELEMPVYISHMSFGALSREAKIALAKGSAMAKTAQCSGEGGILPEEMENAYKYIFEYIPNRYSVTDENLKKADAIEIKIGQGTKPGMGGHLPGEKVTPEIAEIRGKNPGNDIQSPSRIPGIETEADLKALVDELRSRSEGRPVGIKIAAGRIEADLKFALAAGPDFVTVDGRGGATGSSPYFLREATTVPTLFALYRARKYLDEVGSDVELVITGGLRVSADFAKAIAMGADAVAVATAGMIALGCQQYRICGSGMCPLGIATQNPELRKRLDIDKASRRVANYLNTTAAELRTFARVTGHSDIHDLSKADLFTTSREVAEYTDIRHC